MQDTYDPNYYANSLDVDPRAANVLARSRVVRGGGWRGGASDLRSTNRGWTYPEVRNRNLGFRLVREIPDE